MSFHLNSICVGSWFLYSVSSLLISVFFSSVLLSVIMGFFRYRFLWLICLFLGENTRPGQTLQERRGAGELSKKRQFENATTSEATEQYNFQIGTDLVNEWRVFQNWACNAPQVRREATTAFTETVEGSQVDRVLLIGGLASVGSLNYRHSYLNTTWVYYEETNSWRVADNLSARRPGSRSISLVTVCNEYVIQRPAFVRNSTWIFLVKTKEWQQVPLDGESPSSKSYVSSNLGYGVVYVAVRDTHTACHCRQAVIFVPCGSHHYNISSMHQLICVNDSDRMSYRWTTISAKHPGYPVEIICQSVISSASKEMILAIVNGCLWYYNVHVATWTPTTSCTHAQLPAYKSLLSTAITEVEQNVRSYTFLDLLNLRVICLSLSNLPATSERILGNGPSLSRVYSTRTLSNNQFLAYEKEEYYSCGSSKWSLKRENASAIWTWSRLSATVKFPYSLLFFTITSMRHHNFYQLISERDTVSKTRYHLLWVLDLNLMRWQVMQRFNENEVIFDRRSVSTWLEEDLWLIVSRYHTTVIKSMEPLRKIINPISMSRTAFFTLVAVNLTSALLFGGWTEKQNSGFNDLWHFSSTTGAWNEIKLDRPGTLIPSPRYNHAAAVVNSEMFVFGGNNGSDVCLNDLWKFNMRKGKWSIVSSRNPGPLLVGMQPCITTVVAQAGHLWIAVGCGKFYVRSGSCANSEIQIWMFIVHLEMWEHLTITQPEELRTFLLLNLFFWRGYLLRLGSPARSLFYMKVGCPTGLASRNISNVACDICEIRFYADLQSQSCLPCPKGTTTKKQRSSSVSDCNVCVQGYCQHGRCLVVTTDSSQSPYCQCEVGFTGSRCQYATYYYITLGVILFVVAIALSLAIIWYIRRKRKRNERALRQQIEQLNEVWQIGWEEVTVEEEIGGGASGRILLAQYRDLPVAVKMLKANDDPEVSLNFAKEIKFMQTMRHPNIVLFLGAGRTAPPEQPFLVLEFTRRGSLRKVLDDDDIFLSNRRKLDFAVDASKGMTFLHNLNPPRIHRDLKSENLLVSESWVVKVADFGLGRPFSSENTRQPVRRKRCLFVKKKSLAQPLLQTTEELSLDGIGTARWSAPELSRGDQYDGSVDVYRYTDQ